MQPRRLLFLVVALLVAGCLEEPAPTAMQPDGGSGLVDDLLEGDVEDVLDEPLPVTPPTAPTAPTAPTTPPAPTPEPSEPQENWTARELPEGEVLHHALRGDNGTSAHVAVPERVARMVLVVEANVTFDGEVLLLDPDGRLAASCAQRSCEVEARGALAAGDWSLAFLEVPADVRVAVVAQVEAELPPSPPAPAEEARGLTYEHSVRYAGGRVNETDYLGIYATSGRVTGRIVLDVAPGDDALVSIMDGGWNVVARCGGAGPAECAVDLAGASSRAWVVTYSGQGNGTAHVELVHEVEAPASPPADAAHQVFGGSHNYRTWGDRRGDFSNGFVVPSGWGRLLVNVTLPQVGDDFPEATARILLLEPDGDVAGTCERPARECQFRTPATPGRWQVRWEGLDPSSDSRVTALLYASG